MRLVLLFSAFIIFSPANVHGQSGLKKVRMALPTKGYTYLAFYAAYHKGYYKDEGIDLELIIMRGDLSSTAVVTGDIDYTMAATSVIAAAVQGRPMRVLVFTVPRALFFMISNKEIKEPRQLRGKKIAGSSPGGTVTILTKIVLKHYGLDSERDVFLNPMGGTGTSRLAALESGVVDASVLEMPENVIALERGFNELIFFGDFTEFPQNGFGTSEKKIRENPDETLRMVRATLRGLMFIWDENNQEEVLDITMKEWNIANRKMAREMLRHLRRVLTKDASVKPESIQFLVDLARENAKISRPVSVSQVVDFSFADKARKELGLAR